MPRIIYIHQYFRTPKHGGSLRTYYISNHLVKHGHEVHVITAHNSSTKKTARIDGINVHYLPVYYSNNLSYGKRISSFFRFIFHAVRCINKFKHIDLIYTTSTPLTISLIAIYFKRFKRIPFLFEVRDLWPTIPVDLGIMKNPIVKRISFWLEKQAYIKSEKVICLSPGIQQNIKNRYPDVSLEMIPNMCDPNLKSETEIGIEQNDFFKITYTGTIGFANHLAYLIDVAELCEKNNLPIHFTIMGEGLCSRVYLC